MRLGSPHRCECERTRQRMRIGEEEALDRGKSAKNEKVLDANGLKGKKHLH